MPFPATIEVDAKTLLAAITAAVSLWLFFRRWRDESRKTRLVELQKKALDQLFRSRDTLVACLERLDDAPDVESDETANALYGAVRSVRRDIRNTINEFLLFGTRDEYELVSGLYYEADRHYHSFVRQLPTRHVDYSAVNLFKRTIYQLLEDIEVRILQAQELDGRLRTNEVKTVRARYAERRTEIDQLVSSATGFVPVHDKLSTTHQVSPPDRVDTPTDT